jgi:hypothetical protein
MKQKVKKYCKVCNKVEVTGNIKTCDSCKAKAKLRYCKVCGEVEVNKKGQLCNSCKKAKAEADDLKKRTKVCECKQVFIIPKGESTRTRTCPRCLREPHQIALNAILDYFNENGTRKVYIWADESYAILKFSSQIRNNILYTGARSSFKLPYEFENVKNEETTWDHINGMTFTTRNYLLKLIKNYDKYKNLDEFIKYIDKYAVQFKISKNQNRSAVLINFQKAGINPKQYISIMGRIKNTNTGKYFTIDQSIDIIRKHFINQ